ncbi:xylulokinase [Enterococcus sp. AZ135]|uniref:xylulokinase n=1 Tax=unclassified Enterococcus TaxID=2608891 RepID=UPI003F1EF5E8
MSYFLGVDLGTSSLKIILGDEKGNLLGNSSSSFAILSEKIGYSEENPSDWLTAFNKALFDLIRKFPQIKKSALTVGFSGQMHTLVLIDSNGEVLRPAILWNDSRTTEEVKMLEQRLGDHLLNYEKNIPLEGFTLPKIVWIQKNEPDLWRQTSKFMLPKDYLVYSLTGEVFTEPSDGTGTILMDIDQRNWDESLLKHLDIPLDKCPTIKSSTEIIGEMDSKIKKRFGLEGKVELVLGGADNACGAFANISEPHSQGLISVGTSGVVLVYETEKGLSDIGKYHYFASVLEDINYKMGVTLSAGYSLDWLKKILAPNESFATFCDAAEQSSVGSRGITFLPYLFGERSPYFDPNLSGAFVGLRAHHKREDIIRAVMEGIAFSLKNVYENMRNDREQALKTFRITGGVTKNPFWLQLFADIFQVEIEVLSSDEGPAYGALLCAVAGKKDPNLLTYWKQANKIKNSYQPTERAENYHEPYRRFLSLSQQAVNKNKNT